MILIRMVESLFHLAARDAAESWRAIRRRRAAPPCTTPTARAETFQTSLEQAEQQFRAAASVGYDSRPLNLFYGLSQAGRAIAAAARSLGASDWRLNGHGIAARDLDRASIGNVTIKTTGQGAGTSFARLSQLLRSEIPDCELGDVWSNIWETTQFEPLDPARIVVPLQVGEPRQAISPGQAHWHDGAITIDVTLPPSTTRATSSGRALLPDLGEYIDHYPALRDGKTADGKALAGAPWPRPEEPLRLFWPDPEHGTHPNPADQLIAYRGQTRLATPNLPNASRPSHPLMAWWATLFGLSMLARYQPDRWTNMINIDRSPSAIAVEYLLQEALDAVPDLIDQTLEQVS